MIRADVNAAKSLECVALAIMVGSALAFVGCRSRNKQESLGEPSLAKQSATKVELDVETVLSWQDEFEEFLNHDVDKVAKKFGSPTSISKNKVREWFYKTGPGGRSVTFYVIGDVVKAVDVGRKPEEDLPVDRVIRRAASLNFEKDQIPGRTEFAFVAKTPDGKTRLRFVASPEKVIFADVAFICDEFAPSYR